MPSIVAVAITIVDTPQMSLLIPLLVEEGRGGAVIVAMTIPGAIASGCGRGCGEGCRVRASGRTCQSKYDHCVPVRCPVKLQRRP